MKLRVLPSLLLFFIPASQLAAQPASNAQKFSPPTRIFRFSYSFTVKDIPSEAKRVRVWIPVPQTDQHQAVRVLAVKAPAKDADDAGPRVRQSDHVRRDPESCFGQGRVQS